jgi:type IV secretion system protein VirB5
MKRYRPHTIAILVGLATGICAGAPAMAGGVPTFDAANDLMNVQQLQQLVDQLNNMKQQLGQLKQAYDAVNSLTDIGQLANDKNARRYLPDNWQATTNLLDTGLGAGGLGSGGQLNNLAVEARKDTAKLPKNSEVDAAYADYLDLTRKAGDANASFLVSGQAAFDQSAQRIGEVETLLKRLDSAATSAEKEDLQVRITAESAFLQNEMTRLQALNIMADAQARQLEQAQKEQWLRDVTVSQ